MKLILSVRGKLAALCGLFLLLLVASNLYLASLAGSTRSQITVAVALAAGLLLTAMVIQSILRPLNATVRALRQVAARQRSVEMPPPRDDEFGEMARALRELHQHAQTLDRVAYFDPLTGLANRARLEQSLRERLADCGVAGRNAAVMFLDLDHFKSVNDTLGHSFGDRYLIEAALRLRRLMPKGAELFRYSGDEFAVLLPGSSEEALRARVEDTAARILEGLGETYHVEDHHLTMSASIGAALYPLDGREPEDLVSAADAAMYQAKAAGRGQLLFASRELKEALREQLRLAGDIRRGLEAGEFEPHFQPVLNARNGRVIGAEALVRWRHPQRGMVPPGQFIRAAEESGSIGALGAHVLRRGCEELTRLQDRIGDMALAVNLSARQLRDPALVGDVAELLHSSGIRPERLELEITESAVTENVDRNTRTLQSLRGLGVGLSIDDFGTGYSSLSYVQRLPVTKIKIDRSFVAQMGDSRQSEAIIIATLAMASGLGLDVVAEGVETREQSQRLLQLGCLFQQGHLFTPALPADALVEWLSAGPRPPLLN